MASSSSGAPSTRSAGVLIVAALAVQQLVMAYDSTAMNVAISEIVKDLDTTLTGVQSVISVYALVMAALMVTGGKLGSRLGHRRMFVLGALIYAAGALLTAFSPSLPVMLIGWSLLEGMGAALVFPNLLAIASLSFEGPSRTRTISLVGAAAGVGAALGPILGGAITVGLTWRLSFILEVAVTAVVVVIMIRLVEPRVREPKPAFDITGVLLLGLGMALVVLGFLLASTYGLLEARKDFVLLGRVVTEQGGLSPTVILVVVGAVVLLLFALWERGRVTRGKDPLVRLAVLRVRTTRVGTIALALQLMFTAGLMFVVPVYLQTTLGYDALQSGFTLVPSTIALIVAATISSQLVARGRMRRESLTRLAFLLMAVGATLVAVTFGPDSEGTDFLIPLTVAGLGLGGAVVLQDLVQSSAPSDQMSDVAGLSRSSSYLGQAIGVALAGAVLVGVLLSSATSSVRASSVLSPQQKQTVEDAIDSGVSVTAVSDEQVRTALRGTGASPDEVEEVVRINGLARDQGLTAAMVTLAVAAGLGFLVSLRLRGRQAARDG